MRRFDASWMRRDAMRQRDLCMTTRSTDSVRLAVCRQWPVSARTRHPFLPGRRALPPSHGNNPTGREHSRQTKKKHRDHSQVLDFLSAFVKRQGGGGLSETRTRDQRIKSPLLYRLSYQPDRSQKLWLISKALSKNRRMPASALQQHRVSAAPPPCLAAGTGRPKQDGRSRGRPHRRERSWLYQAATTAPLNLVSMNCFTAGL